MNYRDLGNTGLRVSEIGMGCEGFLGKTQSEVSSFLDIMESGGANIIDMYAPDPGFRSALGTALKGRREHFILQAHLCSVWKDGQYKRTRKLSEVREGFSDELRRLGTDHFEIGMIHYCDSLDDWETIRRNGVLQYAQELKKHGVIEAVGMSSHNPEVALAAVQSGALNVLMFSVNPCYDLQPAGEDVEKLWADEAYEKPLLNMDPQRSELYETCQRLGVGITVMKAFGGGDLLSADQSPAGAALTSLQCLHYALTRPAVASVMAGARTAPELQDCLAYEEAGEDEKDYASALASFPKISWKGHCMYCGHCAPCPAGIDVANVTKFLSLAAAHEAVPETVREHYALLPHHASECVQCGACETRCPFEVPVRSNMKKAASVFGL
ncbi:MAG: aldo/keto reductase [Lachnospiraceae bacterium]|jgi:predicted aldo/keto reductase-like oxidoreductase|nr:aldo/keto reductase [Lachnospiraceae bacterium]